MGQPSNEGQIILAIEAIQRDPKLSIRRAATIYGVPFTTIAHRMNGRRARYDSRANSRKLNDLEEEALREHILDLIDQGFPPALKNVGDYADLLLAKRNGGRVGTRWARNFVNRHTDLKTRFSRVYDYQRARCEDPKLIRGWFELVRNMRAKYGISDADFYNFDETGFTMGQIIPTTVVTRFDQRGKAKKIQPGNREWVTLIQGINTEGWCVPPFFAVKGAYHLANWYSETNLPSEWALKPTCNGWTDNETGLDWIRHFNRHIAHRTTGAYRMLVIDNHGSHVSAEFHHFCKENKIILVSMPPYSSHLLQPLDVGCFSPLKRAYGDQVSQLMKSYITNISKVEFLIAFKAIFPTVFREENVKAGFRGAGLVPFDPEAVLSKLNMKLRIPSPQLPSRPSSSHWVSQTPHNPTEADSQSTHIKGRITRHQGSSPTSILEAVDQIAKGTQAFMYKAALLEAENYSLRKANELLSKRRSAKKTRLRLGGSLSIQDAEDLQDQKDVADQLGRETRENGGQRRRVETRARRCGRCNNTGHNSRTCDQVTETSEDASSE